MYAIDTNILIYAHNTDSMFNEMASEFLERVMNKRDETGKLSVCIPAQVVTEFINVITRQNTTQSIDLKTAISIVQDYLKTDVLIIHQKNSQISTLLNLLDKTTTRKKVFDVALAATLKDNDVNGIYTVNTKDFKDFDFLDVINPIINLQKSSLK